MRVGFALCVLVPARVRCAFVFVLRFWHGCRIFVVWVLIFRAQIQPAYFCGLRVQHVSRAVFVFLELLPWGYHNGATGVEHHCRSAFGRREL